MCGIAGVAVRPGHPLPVDALTQARVALGHRGPDDAGTSLDEAHGCGFVHTRLAILDLSPLGHQPMVSRDARLVITYNGEIYNYRSLRARLVADGWSFRGQSDTEVILALYEVHGEAMLPMLDGMFAFALLDRREHRVLLARDAFGVKPLYYAVGTTGLSFASELKALRPIMDDALTLDVPALARYTSFLWSPGEATPARQIRRLPPGAMLRVTHGVAGAPEPWTRLPIAAGVPQDLTEAEAVPAVRAALREAVHRQMVSDVPVGAFLSGGVDSSAIVACAREQSPDIRCFTIAPADDDEEGSSEDLRYARAVASHLRVPLEVVPIEARHLADDLERMVSQLDEPLADPSALNVRSIAALARRAGITVLLSGAGGDDLFSGYRRHAALEMSRWWRWWPRPVRAAATAWTARLDQRRVLARRVTRVFDGAALDDTARMIRSFMWAPPERLRHVWDPAHQAAVSDAALEGPMRAFLSTLPPHTRPLARMLALEQRFFLADHNLLYTDKMAMAEGVETRVPFLDPALATVAARIPDRLHQRGLHGKRILKAAVADWLPPAVLTRPKVGFGAPVRQWVRGPLRPMVRDVLSPEALTRRGLFRPAAVSALIEDDAAGRIDAAYLILSLTCIELWCRHHLDRSA